MLQYILFWIMFLRVENFLSLNIIKDPILKDIAKINRTSKIFAPPLPEQIEKKERRLWSINRNEVTGEGWPMGGLNDDHNPG